MNTKHQPTDASNEYQDRLQKLHDIRERGVNPYPDMYERTHTTREALKIGEEKGVRDTEAIMEKPKDTMKLCGRLVSFRNHGNISFGQIHDVDGRI
ncbi:hypothetical protein GF369_03145, partial [Candidatus Peregrinibacteria bacterium]|nr:hypothetical protein [Candidatus Peregrinibacteria bacterium]